MREFPSDRLNLGNFYDPDGSRPGRTDVKNNQSYLVSEDCRVFDAGFFRINNKEAHGMDPQQRILLETTYEAREAAGWPLEQIEGSSTAVDKIGPVNVIIPGSYASIPGRQTLCHSLMFFISVPLLLNNSQAFSVLQLLTYLSQKARSSSQQCCFVILLL